MAIAGKTTRTRSRKQCAEPAQNAEVLDFLQALDRWKHRHQRSCPSWSELLQLLRELGYRRPKPAARR